MFEKDTSKEATNTASGLGQTSGTKSGTATQQAGKFYVDGQPVLNINESRPTVRQVIEAAGKDATNIDVYRLSTRNDTMGQKISLEERLDGSYECFLRCEIRGEESDRALGVSDIAGSQGQVQRTPSGGNPTGGAGGGQRTGGGGSNIGGAARSPVSTPSGQGQPSAGAGQPQRQAPGGGGGSPIGSTHKQGQSNVGGGQPGGKAPTGGNAEAARGATPAGGSFGGESTAAAQNVGGTTTKNEGEGAQAPGAKKPERRDPER